MGDDIVTQEELRARLEIAEDERDELQHFIQEVADALREAGHPTTAAAPGPDGDEGASHVECVRALAAERDGLRNALASALLNTVPGLSHEVLTAYGAPNGHGLTLLGRIEALADARDRSAERRKIAETERNVLRENERNVLREKVTSYETASWADSVQGEAAWKGRAEVAELALGKARGQLAAMREILNQLVCCVLDCTTCERAGSPDGKSDCPQRVIRRGLTSGAGESEAEVIAAAEKIRVEELRDLESVLGKATVIRVSGCHRAWTACCDKVCCGCVESSRQSSGCARREETNR
jgi:hypothetical protein